MLKLFTKALKLFTKPKYGFFWVINEPKNKANKKDQIVSAIIGYVFLTILAIGALFFYIFLFRFLRDRFF